MKDSKFKEIFKTKKEAPAIPDLSNFTDDLLGPSMSDPRTQIPAEIKMINRKRRVAPFLDPLPSSEEDCENEEENEEGELDSEAAPELSNREQAIGHGFNPEAKQKAKQWDHFKKIDVDTIPRIVATGVDSRSPITPTYQQIKDLPSDIKSPVKALERQLFKMITTTPINNIQVIAHVDGGGPNSFDEFDAVHSWVKHEGKQDHDLIDELQKKIGGIEMFHTEGISHLVVDNSAGKFVFSWPSVDNHVRKGTV